jgi:hypothetical protein
VLEDGYKYQEDSEKELAAARKRILKAEAGNSLVGPRKHKA